MSIDKKSILHTNNTETMKKTAVVHPFLFAAYPVLSLLAFNINQTSWEQAVRSLLLSLGTALVLLLFWRLVTRDWQKAGLMTTIMLLLFFAYGHVIRLLQGQNSELDLFHANRYLTAVWMSILILGLWFVWRIVKRDIGGLTQFLNIAIGIALVFPMYTIVTQEIRSSNDIQPSETVVSSPSATASTFPDIYYIVLDAYTSDAVLDELYNFDNSPFLQSLQARGFYIANESHSNYSQTLLSLPSTLNMSYLDAVQEQAGKDSEDRRPLEQFLHQNEVVAFLKEHGYQTAAISSGWQPTEFTEFDHYYTSNFSIINGFEVMLIQDTWLGSLFSLKLTYEQKRRQNLYIFDALQDVSELASPKFVFAHSTITHVPYVFGPNGEPLNPGDVYSMHDGAGMNIDQSAYIQRYPDQVRYTNQLLAESIDHILATSETPPVIILQGDHGPGLTLDYESVDDTCAKERLSIFNAYYLSDDGVEELYESISPVNTFRVILNAYFNTDLELLEDRSYYALWSRPYDPIEVTDRLDIPCDIGR